MNDEARYDNAYSEENTYGAVLRLLRRSVVAVDEPAVLLDLASGYGAIATAVQEQLGATYVGVDVDEDAVAALRDSGFEAHVGDVGDPEAVRRLLRDIVGDRRVLAITMLDGLEHLPAGRAVLAEVSAFLRDHSAPLVLSVPNNSHRDVGFKLAFGAWEYTETGLLDDTHVHLYSEPELERTLRAAGLHRTDREDFLLSKSDQHFPLDHPALMRGTTINQWMNALRDQAAPNARVNQFVWACLPGPVPAAVESRPSTEDDPFLTVVIRTQGRRPQQLAEVFSCLAGQTDQDFEVLLVGHHVDVATQIVLERLVERQPPSIAGRTRFVKVDHGSRATLLNEGFRLATGQYVVALDDDDLVFAHWVSAFRDVHRKHPGMVLRSVGSLQAADVVSTSGQWAVRTEGPITRPYDAEFSMVKHLVLNQTPFMTAAFPRGLFTNLGLRFDESLTTTEDWDYLLRAASLVGVADSLQLTAIYHTWVSQDGSRTDHDIAEWLLNQYSVDRKIDALPILLPAGETRRIRELVKLAEQPAPAPAPVVQEPTVDHGERFALAQRLISLLESRSWRVSAPLRAVSRLRGTSGPVRASAFVDPATDEQILREAIDAVLRSRSWRSTRWLRRGGI